MRQSDMEICRQLRTADWLSPQPNFARFALRKNDFAGQQVERVAATFPLKAAKGGEPEVGLGKRWASPQNEPGLVLNTKVGERFRLPLGWREDLSGRLRCLPPFRKKRERMGHPV